MDFLIKVMYCSLSLLPYIFKLKMSVADIKKISEDDLKARLNELIDVNDYLDGCGTCCLPHSLLKDTTCIRNSQAEASENVRFGKTLEKELSP